MPATATWPRPSPISDMPFCTRNTPMSGADAPTTTPASSASCMYCGRTATAAPTASPAATFTAARSRLRAPRARAGGRRGGRRGSRRWPRARRAGRRTRTRRFSTITWSRSSATAPSSCDTRSTAAPCSLHEVDERVAEQPLRLDVDAGDRLVEHEQLGLGRERLARSARAAAGRPRARRAARRWLGERDRLERVVDRLAVGGAAPPPPALLGQATGRDDLLDGGREIGRDARALRHVPDPPAVAEVVRRRAEELDRARLRRRAARAGSAAASTSPSRWARRARRTRRRAPRGSRRSSTELGAVGERHVGRPRARRRTGPPVGSSAS